MRDEPSGAPIPERLEPSDFNMKQKQAAELELATLEAMSDREIVEARNSAEEARRVSEAEYLAKMVESKRRYQAMLDKVNEWEPPTEDRVEMKNFMTKQLVESIRFDCSGKYWHSESLPPAEEWLRDRINGLIKKIQYHAEEHEKEVARTECRNKWLSDLRASLSRHGFGG